MANEGYRPDLNILFQQVLEQGTADVQFMLESRKKYRDADFPGYAVGLSMRYFLSELRKIQRMNRVNHYTKPWDMPKDQSDNWAMLADAVQIATAKLILKGHPDYSTFQIWGREDISTSINTLFRGDGSLGLRIDDGSFKLLGLPDDRNERHGIPDIMAVSNDGTHAHSVTVNKGGLYQVKGYEEYYRVARNAASFECDYGKEIVQRSLNMSAECAESVLLLLRESSDHPPIGLPYTRTVPAGLLQMDRMIISVLERIAHGSR